MSIFLKTKNVLAFRPYDPKSVEEVKNVILGSKSLGLESFGSILKTKSGQEVQQVIVNILNRAFSYIHTVKDCIETIKSIDEKIKKEKLCQKYIQEDKLSCEEEILNLTKKTADSKIEISALIEALIQKDQLIQMESTNLENKNAELNKKNKELLEREEKSKSTTQEKETEAQKKEKSIAAISEQLKEISRIEKDILKSENIIENKTKEIEIEKEKIEKRNTEIESNNVYLKSDEELDKHTVLKSNLCKVSDAKKSIASIKIEIDNLTEQKASSDFQVSIVSMKNYEVKLHEHEYSEKTVHGNPTVNKGVVHYHNYSYSNQDAKISTLYHSGKEYCSEGLGGSFYGESISTNSASIGYRGPENSYGWATFITYARYLDTPAGNSELRNANLDLQKIKESIENKNKQLSLEKQKMQSAENELKNEKQILKKKLEAENATSQEYINSSNKIILDCEKEISDNKKEIENLIENKLFCESSIKKLETLISISTASIDNNQEEIQQNEIILGIYKNEVVALFNEIENIKKSIYHQREDYNTKSSSQDLIKKDIENWTTSIEEKKTLIINLSEQTLRHQSTIDEFLLEQDSLAKEKLTSQKNLFTMQATNKIDTIYKICNILEMDLPILNTFTSAWDENKINLSLPESMQQEILSSIEEEKRKKEEKKQKKDKLSESFSEQKEEEEDEFECL